MNTTEHTNIINNIISLPDNIKYTASQVSRLYTGMTVSKVRYYMKMFEPILDLDYSNKMRRFTKNSLICFDTIIKFRNDGMTIQQISDLYNKENTDNTSLIENDYQLKTDITSKSIIIQIESLLYNMKDVIVKEIMSQIEDINSELKEDIVVTVDELISEKLKSIDNIENILTNKNYNMDLYMDKIQDKFNVFEIQQENIYKTTISILDDYTPKEANKKLSLLNIKHKVK